MKQVEHRASLQPNQSTGTNYHRRARVSGLTATDILNLTLDHCPAMSQTLGLSPTQACLLAAGLNYPRRAKTHANEPLPR